MAIYLFEFIGIVYLMNLDQLDDRMIAAGIAAVSMYMELEIRDESKKKKPSLWRRSMFFRDDLNKINLWRSIS
jgi:hypothetical protein